MNFIDKMTNKLKTIKVPIASCSTHSIFEIKSHLTMILFSWYNIHNMLYSALFVLFSPYIIQ